jgi:hypothetical protein
MLRRRVPSDLSDRYGDFFFLKLSSFGGRGFFFGGECEFFEHANFVDLRGGVKGWVGESLQGEIAAQKILVFLALYTVGVFEASLGINFGH